MNKQEQIKFVNDLTETVKQGIIESIEAGKVPDNWDGYELRWLIAEKFSDVVWSGMRMDSKRKREYKNTCIINDI